MTPPVLHAEHLAKSFGRGRILVRAVDDVSLDLGVGEMVTITGPSGSGKTTLVSMLGALLRPDSGTIIFDGTDIATLGEAGLAALRARKIGFVFQSFNLLEALSARDNVLFPASLAPCGVRAARDRADALLERLGLSARRCAAGDTIGRREAARRHRARAHQPAETRHR